MVTSTPRQQRLMVIGVEDRLWSRLETELAAFVVDDVATFAEARPLLGQRSYAAWIVGVDRARDLDALSPSRRAGLSVPVLALCRKDDVRIANQAQLLDVECVFGSRVLDNVQAFLERLAKPAVRRRVGVLAAVERLSARKRLSPREREMVQAIARGVARNALAAELGVAESTAKTMVRHLMIKLEVRNVEDIRRFLLQGG